MSNLSDHVTLTIVEDNVGITRAGFGMPLILSHSPVGTGSASWTERVRFYTDLPGVGVDFVATSPEYLAAKAMFGQSPHVEQIAIGRASTNKPTQVYVIGVAAVANNQAYAVNVAGQGVTTSTATYTSDGSATNDEIAGGLVSALNGIAGKNYTAAATGSGGSLVVTVTGNAVGQWFSLEVTNTALLSNKQTHTDPGVATDLDAIQLEQPDWYALHTNFNSQGYVTGVASWVSAQTKIYVVDVCETHAITAATVNAGTNDTPEALATSAYARVACGYHPSPVSMFSAGWLGRMLPLDPGSDNWKFKTLAGIPAVRLTATHRTNLRARHANCIETVAGRNITWEGTVADGDFIDITRGIDWMEDDLTKGVFGALAGAQKIPFTDNGIAIIENEVIASLKRATSRGILAADPKFVVTVPAAADVSASDKALRLLPDVKFSGTLAGAVNKVNMSGTVSV